MEVAIIADKAQLRGPGYKAGDRCFLEPETFVLRMSDISADGVEVRYLVTSPSPEQYCSGFAPIVMTPEQWQEAESEYKALGFFGKKQHR